MAIDCGNTLTMTGARNYMDNFCIATSTKRFIAIPNFATKQPPGTTVILQKLSMYREITRQLGRSSRVDAAELFIMSPNKLFQNSKFKVQTNQQQTNSLEVSDDSNPCPNLLESCGCSAKETG